MTLYLWWARRPLAACRDLLFASVVDDSEADPRHRRPDGSVGGTRLRRCLAIGGIFSPESGGRGGRLDAFRAARADEGRCPEMRASAEVVKVEVTGFEPVTSSMPWTRSPS